MPYTPELAEEYIRLEALEQGIDPHLAVAVARQESGMSPHAKGDGGKALGLFQLHPRAAIDAGIDPTTRGDLLPSITGGVRYLKQQLDKEGGHVERALSRYNRGTPEYRGMGDPNYVTNVMQRYGAAGESPRDAMTRAQERAGQAPAKTRRQLLEEEYRAIEALEASRAAPTAPAAAPAPSAVPSATPTVPAGGPTRSQGPPADLEITIEKDSPDALPPTAAAPAPPGAPVGDPQRGFLPPGVPTIAEETLEETESPLEMLIGGIGMGRAGRAAKRLGTSVADVVWPAGRRLLGAGAQALGMEGVYKAQQATGLAPGDPSEVGLGDVINALPVAAEMGGAVKRWVVRHLPGAPAALHEDVAQRLAKAVQDLAPPGPSGPLYTAALAHNPPIGSTRIGTEALRIARHEQGLSPSLQNPKLRRVAEDMQDLVMRHRNQVPLQRMYDEMQRLGLKVKEARSTGGTELADYQKLYGAFHRDMEIAASRGVPGAAQLKEAISTARREFAVDDLAELFTPGAGRGLSTRADGLVTISGGGLRDRLNKVLRTNDTLRNTFKPGELKDIYSLITEAERLPRIPASPGQVTGSSQVLGRAVAGSYAGTAVANPAMAAMMPALAIYAPKIIAAGLMHPVGRRMIRSAIREHGAIDPMTMAALSSLVRTVEPGIEIVPKD